MYLETIDITYIEPCFADTEKVRFKAELSTDIADLMPYLNSVMKNAIYNKNVPSITLKFGFRLITLYRDTLAGAKAVNETDAFQTLKEVKDLINQTHEKLNEIEPVHEMHSRPTALEIYGWLPRTNCKTCGEATCMAFAAKLLTEQQKIKNCTPLFEKGNEAQLEAMSDILEALGYEIPNS